jgi:hypothetical protein
MVGDADIAGLGEGIAGVDAIEAESGVNVREPDRVNAQRSDPLLVGVSRVAGLGEGVAGENAVEAESGVVFLNMYPVAACAGPPGRSRGGRPLL